MDEEPGQWFVDKGYELSFSNDLVIPEYRRDGLQVLNIISIENYGNGQLNLYKWEDSYYGGTVPTPSFATGQQAFKLGKALNKMFRRGQAPRSVTDVHLPSLNTNGTGYVHGQQPHIHFDNKALNLDGTWKHGEGAVPSRIIRWINKTKTKLQMD